MGEVVDLSLYAKRAEAGRHSMDFAVEGVACGGCIERIESAVKQLPGITDARLNFTNRRLHVTWADGAVNPADILQTLRANG
jgi:Cu2+-exporting ATPase